MIKPNYNKLELTWVGKGDRSKLEPRILLENPQYSFGCPKSKSMIIQGDNLLALKALEQEFSGKVKCIYIDPPYNTGNAFEHYDDGIEHSLWLNLMSQRLQILKNLLSYDGAIFVQIDDSEGAYLKVLMDEIFGRNSYQTTFYIQVRYGNKTLNEDNDYQKLIEQILVYKKDDFRPNKQTIEYSIDKFCWKITELSEGETEIIGGRQVVIFKNGQYKIEQIEPSINGLKETWATGSLVKQGGSAAEFFDLHLSARKDLDGLNTLYKVIDMGTQGDGLGYRYISGPKKASAAKGKFYTGVPLEKISDIKAGSAKKEIPISNFYDYSGSFGNCRLEGGVSFNGGKKPEDLVSMIIEMSTNPGDLVFDSFLGSGTTAAVAHKMGRQFIGIELGEQAITHCFERLKSVVNGSDQSGVSKVVGWKGGGGFKFYTLAPSLLNEDKYGNWIISKEYNAEMLAAAMAKQEGFMYEPDEHVYWKQGKSSEKDFIFTTTQFITVELLDKIHEEMQSGESLLIACKSYQESCSNRHANISIKKIPHMLMGRCEFGKDDYSFNIVNMPHDDEAENFDEPESTTNISSSKKSKTDSQQELF